MKPNALIGPVIVIAIGFVFLLNNLGWNLPLWELIGNLWPLVVIGVGLAQIAGSFLGRGSLSGGIVVSTVGVLFTLQQFFGISFRDTWPVVVIAAGVGALLRGATGQPSFGHRCMKGVRR